MQTGTRLHVYAQNWRRYFRMYRAVSFSVPQMAQTKARLGCIPTPLKSGIPKLRGVLVSYLGTPAPRVIRENRAKESSVEWTSLQTSVERGNSLSSTSSLSPRHLAPPSKRHAAKIRAWAGEGSNCHEPIELSRRTFLRSTCRRLLNSIAALWTFFLGDV